PAEVTFDAIPGARPLVLRVLPVIGIAIDDPLLPFFRKPVERHIRGRLSDFAEFHQVILALGAVAAEPRFDDTLRQRFGAVGQRQVVVDPDDASEAAAGRAGAERMVETEQGRRGLTIFDVALRAVKAIAEMKRRNGG